MTEEQRSLWTMSVPITFEYNNAMQDFKNLSYSTNESAIGEESSTQLLCTHIFTACDRTSRIFGIGNKTVFQTLLIYSTLQSCATLNPPKFGFLKFGIFLGPK